MPISTGNDCGRDYDFNLGNVQILVLVNDECSKFALVFIFRRGSVPSDYIPYNTGRVYVSLIAP